eukprot:TRINITY_DN17060_c0_g1_i1.p1 TRINITY_DN17060_c0_g1~~TRINITY_DN17060_c0_g1_i1.p1  ORF type:complete len:133 (+),score=29.37 TRINITY_DN17060_c0_g1_i1:146-544(+)
MLRLIQTATVRMYPWGNGLSSSREFICRAMTPKNLKAFPDCVVHTETLKTNEPPTLHLKFENGHEEKIQMDEMSVNEVMTKIDDIRDTLDRKLLDEMLKVPDVDPFLEWAQQEQEKKKARRKKQAMMDAMER